MIYNENHIDGSIEKIKKARIPESEKKSLVLNLNNQCTLPANVQSLRNIPSSTKAMNLNILSPFWDSKQKSSAKTK